MTRALTQRAPNQVSACNSRALKGKQQLIEHNLRFSSCSEFLTKIHEDKVLYGSLAGSHLNLALRLLQQGASSPAGDLSKLCESNLTLEDTVQNGHKWWILKEQTPLEDQVDISLWRNQDQNENHASHEIEILQHIVATADIMRSSSAGSQSNRIVSMSDLVAKALRRTPTNVRLANMTTLCKFWSQTLQSGHPGLIQELVDFHAARVNPRNLVISPHFFDYLQKEEGLARAPLLKHYLILTQYTEEKTRATTTGPSQALFLEAKDITNLGKKADWVKSLEALLADARSNYLPLLEATSSKTQARLELSVLADLFIRCALAKPWPESLKGLLNNTPTGKFSQDKAETLKQLWASWFDSKSNASTFAKGRMLVCGARSEVSGDHGGPRRHRGPEQLLRSPSANVLQERGRGHRRAPDNLRVSHWREGPEEGYPGRHHWSSRGLGRHSATQAPHQYGAKF